MDLACDIHRVIGNDPDGIKNCQKPLSPFVICNASKPSLFCYSLCFLSISSVVTNQFDKLINAAITNNFLAECKAPG